MSNNRIVWWRRPGVGFGLGTMILIALGGLAWWLQKSFANPIEVGFVSGFYGGLIAAGAAGVAAWVAWIQLNSLADTAREDSNRKGARFALQLKNDFFTDRARVLMELITEDWLVYENTKADGTPLAQPYFAVDDAKINASSLPEELKKRLTSCEKYSCYEIDDLLLAHFEDLHSLWKRKLLDLGLIYEGFSWYIEQCANNCAIRRYLDDEAKDSPDLWSGFLKLHDVLKNYDPDQG